MRPLEPMVHRATRRVRGGICLLLVLLFGVSGAPADQPSRLSQLARRWAPIVRQQVSHDRADFVTRFDYDGNWNGADNWENLERGFSLEAVVYQSAVETESHVFLVYALFHPRDYTIFDNSIFSHENDLEGVLVVLERASGQPVLVQTQAHRDFFSYAADPRLSAGTSSIEGRACFAEGRPVVTVQSRTHAIHAWNGRAMEEKNVVVYRPSDTSEVPRGRSDPDCGYALIPVEESLWPRRFDVGPASTFSAPGPLGYGLSFNGDTHRPNSADAPWAWRDKNDDAFERGAWFCDPARVVPVQVTLPSACSRRYLYNPYLPADERASLRARRFERLHRL